jgi:myosin protein heavy chain
MGFRTPKPAVNDSFVSTASSHDLTLHQPRANASFDHLTGAKGVGRFDATKLNTYLHGLNRRLVEENEELARRLESQKGPASTILEADESTRALEIAALEDVVKDLEAELAKEREEKEKERLNFKQKVKEVEDGVEDVVERLERELENLEEANEQAAIKARRAQDLKEDAEERANRAEIALAKLTRSTIPPRSDQAFGSPAGSCTAATGHEDFKEALERVAELEAELRLTSIRCEGLEGELKSADEALEELRIDKQASDRKLLGTSKKLEKSEAKAAERDRRVQELEEELQESQQSAEILMAELGDAHEDVAVAKEELEGAKADIEVLQEKAVGLESRCERFEREARQMEEALEAGEKQMMQDQEELASLRGEVERLRLVVPTGQSAVSSARASTNTAVSMHDQSTNGASPISQEEIDALEKEIDDAHREIGRLQHLLRDSPMRAALVNAKDSKIDALEKGNAELEEKVRTLRVLISKGPLPGNFSLVVPGTPKQGSTLELGASPVVRPMPSFRGPKTPGGPLKDVCTAEIVPKL